MKFTKMQGCGNDYVYIDTFHTAVNNRSELARSFGIGSDGLIFINPSTRADFEMEMYNLDGSRAQMCGNGMRCVGKYVFDHGLTQKTSFTVDTLSGIKQVRLETKDGKVKSVSVDMGGASILAEELPLCTDAFDEYREGAGSKLTVLGRSYTVTCVSMGNPHCVIFTDEPVEQIDLERIGAAFEVPFNIPRFY